MLSLLHLKKQTCLNSPCLFYCLLSYKAMLLSRNLYFHLPIHLQNYDSLASFAMTPSRPPTSWSCLIQETLRIQNVSHCPLAPWNSFLVFCDTTHWGFHPPSWLSSHPTDHISSVFITNPSSALLVNVSVPQRSISLFFFFFKFPYIPAGEFKWVHNLNYFPWHILPSGPLPHPYAPGTHLQDITQHSVGHNGCTLSTYWRMNACVWFTERS